MKTPAQKAHLFHFETRDPELDRLLRPAAAYASPGDVLRDTDLTTNEKKAVLASWASDACAVDSKPAWRQPPGFSQPVSFDDIMSALQELDRSTIRNQGTRGQRPKEPNQPLPS